MTRYTVKKLGTNWWITGADDGPIGPYATRAVAESNARDLRRLERHGDEPDFVTTDKRKE